MSCPLHSTRNTPEPAAQRAPGSPRVQQYVTCCRQRPYLYRHGGGSSDGFGAFSIPSTHSSCSGLHPRRRRLPHACCQRRARPTSQNLRVGHSDVPAAQRAEGYPQVRCAAAVRVLVCAYAHCRRGVMQLDFTRDGKFLISVGLDDSHTAGMLAVFILHLM
jgi:hypothetical protein